MIKTGYVGDIWNSQIRVTKKQTSGTVYALADPEFMGVISVRIDLDQMDVKTSRYLEKDRCKSGYMQETLKDILRGYPLDNLQGSLTGLRNLDDPSETIRRTSVEEDDIVRSVK